MLVNNTSKTEDIIFGSASDTHIMPVFIHNEKIRLVKTYKYLGVMIDDILILSVKEQSREFTFFVVLGHLE